MSAPVRAGLYLGRRFGGAPANTAFSGCTLTDAVLRYDLPRLGGVTLAAANLFDVDYVT